MIDLDKFLQGYISAALWSTMDCRDEAGNDIYNLDDEFDDVSPACRAAMKKDCEDFITAQRDRLEAFKGDTGCDDFRLGFLFWLNREGHGSGFWDEQVRTDDRTLGEELSDACRPYGSFPLYGDFEMGCVRSHHYG